MTLRIEIGKPKFRAWHDTLKEDRQGVILHYDASASDKGAIGWLEDDDRVRVSYHYLVLDDGRILQVAPPTVRAWHAGVCRPSDSRFTYRDANSAFYGVSIAATDGDVATSAQVTSVARLCQYLFWLEGWDTDETWRITGHDAEAWERGRKVDPKGTKAVPVLDVQVIRSLLPTAGWTGIP